MIIQDFKPFVILTFLLFNIGGCYLFDTGGINENDSNDNNDNNNNNTSEYSVHYDILTTMFYAGEGANSDNGGITNDESAWADHWAKLYGGIDDPNNRNGYYPGEFTPKENPFYFALPYNDFDVNGNKKKNMGDYIPWYDASIHNSTSISAVKNRWIKISYKGKDAYAQWEDVGPFGEDDEAYVFGDKQPANDVNGAGLDVSPAVNDYLGLNGEARVDWVFVDYKDVTEGPWKNIITTSDPVWN